MIYSWVMDNIRWLVPVALGGIIIFFVCVKMFLDNSDEPWEL